MNIAEFQSGSRNEAWVEEPGLSLHVHKPRRGRAWDIEILNVVAENSGSGALSALLDRLEPDNSILFQNVVSVRFFDGLEKRGYEVFSVTTLPSMLRIRA